MSKEKGYSRMVHTKKQILTLPQKASKWNETNLNATTLIQILSIKIYRGQNPIRDKIQFK